MNPLLKNKLKYLAEELREEGIEAMENLQPVDYLDFEELLNIGITEESDNHDQKFFNDLISIRFFIRIWHKYGRNISKGLNLMQNYES